jgi:hypothetical protein
VLESSTANSHHSHNSLLQESVLTIFDDVSDVMPAGRTKVIHSVGVVATVAFEASGEEHPFSGLFKTGAKAGWFLDVGERERVRERGRG